jgi:hypothetical protein
MSNLFVRGKAVLIPPQLIGLALSRLRKPMQFRIIDTDCLALNYALPFSRESSGCIRSL